MHKGWTRSPYCAEVGQMMLHCSIDHRILESRAESGNTQLIVTTHSPILPDHIPDESLFVCQKKSNGTSIEPFSSWGPLVRRSDIDTALEDGIEPLPVSQRMLRGDFDG